MAIWILYNYYNDKILQFTSTCMDGTEGHHDKQNKSEGVGQILDDLTLLWPRNK